MMATQVHEQELTLADQVVRLATLNAWLIGIAESCTGGSISAQISRVSGASKVFQGSVVAYANEPKTSLLGVSKEAILSRGAVSKVVAESMAQGVIPLLGCNLGIGVTGIAGPGGGNLSKPVGTIYMALARPGYETIARQYYFEGDRSEIRQQTIDALFEWLIGLDAS